MTDLATAAPNAGAQPVTQNIDASQTSVEQGILAAIQANADAPLSEKPANAPESPSGDDLANPFASTGEAPKAEPEPQPEEESTELFPDQAQPESTEQQATEAQSAESARQLIKQSNIDPAVKKELSDDVFRARRFKELGFSVEHAEALKDLGITPEIVIERTTIHPTLEDAKRDAALAANMREIAQDLSTDPSAFLSKVAQANPAMADSIRAAIRGEIKSPEDLGEQVWFPFVQQSTWNLLDNLERTAGIERDGDLKEAVAILRAKVFGQNAQPPQPKPQAKELDPNDPVRKELEQLRSEKARLEGNQRAQWASSLQDEGLKLVSGLASQYLAAQGVASLPGSFSADASRELAMSVLGAIGSDSRLKADAETFLQGPMTRERYEQALGWLKSRAAALVNVHGQRVREKYRPLVSSNPNSAQPSPSQRPVAAPRPDVARPSGVAPRPSAGPSPTQQVFAAQKKGMSIEQMIAANAEARVGRRR